MGKLGIFSIVSVVMKSCIDVVDEKEDLDSSSLDGRSCVGSSIRGCDEVIGEEEDDDDDDVDDVDNAALAFEEEGEEAEVGNELVASPLKTGV